MSSPSMSSPSVTPLAPTRWAAIFEKQAESTVGDYDMRASAAYIRSPIGSPQLRGLQRSELDLPLLGATKAPAAAPAALEESGATAAFKAILYGFINTIVVTPVMIGFCAIIFRHEAFHRDPAVYAQLVKLCLFSSAVHQAVFTATSSLPFAIGQVQDAGLIFLSKMACDLANEMEHEPPEALLSTVLVTLSASTALLGLALIITGKLQLAALVQYLPLPVVGGYLAFIGLYCIEAGLSLMTGLEVDALLGWDAACMQVLTTAPSPPHRSMPSLDGTLPSSGRSCSSPTPSPTSYPASSSES